ncbi:hypothetical protein [Pseudomonas syringae]|nr:hypothetical protein [Pseudomonas syringae]MCF5241281.1 hypothetical protein [Pseudomonas syringae]
MSSLLDGAEQADAYLELAQPFDMQGRYLNFDTLRFRFTTQTVKSRP